MSFPFADYIDEAKKQGHSQEFIDTTIQYASVLDDRRLPVIFTRQHFASLVGLPSNLIAEIIQFRANQYHQFSIPKRNSEGFRLIKTPEKKLMYLQRWINKNILQNVQLNDCCTAFLPGVSLASNGYIHKNSKKILKVDLLKFFDTITEKRVYGFFKYLGYHPNVAFDLAQICTVYPTFEFWDSLSEEEIKKIGTKIPYGVAVLPQGAPTSPQLANCIANTLDNRLMKLAEKLNCRYSRYADDIVFSIADANGTLPSISLLKRIIDSEGFFINPKKTKYLKCGMKQIITGLTVTHGFHTPKEYRQKIYKHLYYSKKYGPFNHLKRWMKDNKFNNDTIYGFKDWLLGHISFIFSIDINVGRKMLEEFNKIKWGFEENDVEVENSTAYNIGTANSGA